MVRLVLGFELVFAYITLYPDITLFKEITGGKTKTSSEQGRKRRRCTANLN